MIAALYVQPRGVYSRIDGVDPWDEARDARRYAGPYPVVAHPPCARWGRYWAGGPSSPRRYQLGDDGGMFESALASVRRFGGVIEHPAGSHAWAHFGLQAPPTSGAWVPAGDGHGVTAYVEQGHYGHPARKGTWLYVAGVPLSKLPRLASGKSTPLILPRPGRDALAERRRGAVERQSKNQRAATPPAFADLLVSIARRAG